MSQITMGSLFDGSGGFPLAGALCGVEPLWASEIEPYPIAVTRSRFPNMKHLGNVSDIRGGDIEPVDIITFGSPCQDMSVAGKRAGLKHEVNGDDETTRSGLFMEAVRIIREMRKATNGEKPRFVIWENVPGAFSSNQGKDFRTVLGELVKIVEPNAVMPAVPKAGWPYADSYHGDGWSLAYRVFDAQYWGVHQRRRRIYLVLDLRGERAGKILFEREGVRWDSAQGGEAREGAADDAAGGAGRSVCYGICSYASNAMLSSNPNSGIYEAKTSRTIDINGGNPACNQGGICVVYPEKARTLSARHDSSPCVDRGQNVAVIDCRNMVGNTEVSGTLQAKNEGGYSLNFVNPVVYSSGSFGSLSEGVGCIGTGTRATAEMVAVYDCRGNGSGDIVPNLTGDHENRVTDYSAICLQGNGIDRADTAGCNGCGFRMNEAYTLNTIDRHAVCIGNGQMHQTDLGEKTGALNCMHDQQAVIQSAKPPRRYIVRRLTPLECCRLQGFPDGWADTPNKDRLSDDEYQFWVNVRNTHASVNGKAVKDYTREQMIKWYNGLHTDSAEYKMWGNGIALPTALYCMKGIAEEIMKTK